MTPFWEASRGLNHIDGRLEPSSNYGVLGPVFGAHPPDPRSGVWGPRSRIWGAVFYLGDSVESQDIPWDPGSGVPGIWGNSSSIPKAKLALGILLLMSY